MLELTRKIGERVEIGKPVALTLTIIKVDTDQVHVRLVTNDDERVYFLRQGITYSVVLQAGKVQITLLDIDRGDARIGFDAPRNIPIERPDRKVS